MKFAFACTFLLLFTLVESSHVRRLSETRAPRGSKSPKASKVPATVAAPMVDFIDTMAELETLIQAECGPEVFFPTFNTCNDVTNFGNGQQRVTTFELFGNSPSFVDHFCCSFLPDDPLFDIAVLEATSFCDAFATQSGCWANPDGRYMFIPTAAGDEFNVPGICCARP